MTNTLNPQRWSLADLLPEPIEQSIATALADLDTAVSDFEAQRARLTDGLAPDEFLSILRQDEAIAHRAVRLGA